jgi:fructose-1,6-bisphosphatase/inositol monophosphatase family enzyme
VRERARSLAAWVEPIDHDSILRVAEGQLEVHVDGVRGRIWDRAPLVVIVEEAGGRYRDRAGGRDLSVAGGLFTNGRVDAELDVAVPTWV